MRSQVLFISIMFIYFFANSIEQDLSCALGKDKYCISCSNEGTCLTCIASTLGPNGQICTAPKIHTSNCGTYKNNSSECTACLFGWYLDSSKSCVANDVPNCYYQIESGKCLLCNRSELTEQNTCKGVDTCLMKKDVQTNSLNPAKSEVDKTCLSCVKVNEVQICKACARGFYASYDKDEKLICLPSADTYMGCSAVLNNKCLGCSLGFYVSSPNQDEIRCTFSDIYNTKIITKNIIIIALAFIFWK